MDEEELPGDLKPGDLVRALEGLAVYSYISMCLQMAQLNTLRGATANPEGDAYAKLMSASFAWEERAMAAIQAYWPEEENEETNESD